MKYVISILFFAILLFHASVIAAANVENSCGFVTGLEDINGLRCGSLDVSEDHDDPKSRKISIVYIVVKSKAEIPAPDPVIFFSGGPGGGTIDAGFIGFMKDSLLAETRDIILFDQRGIGYSSPLPDIGKEVFDAMAADTNIEGERILIAKTLKKFKQLTAFKGIDLGNYNSIQNARDTGALMDHLGYKKYNLFGVSYGTRLARTVQDLFPEKINSVTLDSPNLMTDDFLIGRLRSFSSAADKIFIFCEQDAECRKKHPQLRKKYVDVVKKLEKTPLEIKYENSSFFINPQDAVYFLRRQLYSNDAKIRFPDFVEALRSGSKDILKDAVMAEREDVSKGSFNTSMFLAVSAYESMNPANTPVAISKIYSKLPYFPAQLGFFTNLYIEGMNWHGRTMPMNERKFTRSSVPTIIFVNQYDPVTPPENGEFFQQKLDSSHLFIIDEGGHAGGDVECKMKIMIRFMNDPKLSPDSSCLKLFK